MAASATISKQHDFTEPLSASVMRKENPDLYQSNMPRMYPIHRHIHLYSVSTRDFTVKHPYFKGILSGCHKGERYVKCYSVPDPPQQIAVDAERGGFRVEAEPRDEAGWRVAIDILNPNNPSLDPYYQLSAGQAAYFATGKDVDLVKFGLFPSLNAPPTEQEIQKAERARDDSRQALVDEAFQEQASNPQGFRLWLRQHPEVYDAMEALGVEADWMSRPEAKMKCPNCGDSIKAGIAFHKSSAGTLCILDPERAFKAGAIVKERYEEMTGTAKAKRPS